MSYISILLIGFIFGLRHAFDADHILAISTLNSRNKNYKSALLNGLFWGIGHTSVLLVAAFFVLMVGKNIPESFSNIFELGVGVMLIILGAKTIRDFLVSRRSSQTRVSHNHFPVGRHAHKTSFLIGIIHGLAGSAALLIVVVSTVKSLFLGLIYILMFGLGLIISMALFSMIFILFLNKLHTKRAAFGAGILSVLGGVFVLVTSI